MTRVVLTAGFDRSPYVIALASLLRKDGVSVAGVLVVSVANIARLRGYLRQRGFAFVASAVRRSFGKVSGEGDHSPLRDYLKEHLIMDRSLRQWCVRHGVAYCLVGSLDDARALSFVTKTRADGVLYGGGGVLRAAFIEAARGRILNAHHGPLPQIRGMNACEWSLLLGEAPAVSVHYIDRGIDTGPLLEKIPIFVRSGATLGSLREQCTVAGIEGLRRNVGALHEPVPELDSQRASFKQVYTLAPALSEILIRRLSAGSYASTLKRRR